MQPDLTARLWVPKARRPFHRIALKVRGEDRIDRARLPTVRHSRRCPSQVEALRTLASFCDTGQPPCAIGGEKGFRELRSPCPARKAAYERAADLSRISRSGRIFSRPASAAGCSVTTVASRHRGGYARFADTACRGEAQRPKTAARRSCGSPGPASDEVAFPSGPIIETSGMSPWSMPFASSMQTLCPSSKRTESARAACPSPPGSGNSAH